MDNEAVSRLPRNVKDKTGFRAGRLTVIKFAGMRGKRAYPSWWVKCDCGTEKIILGRSIGRPTLSCGCLQAEWSRAPKPHRRKHGLTRSRINMIHHNMMERCSNPKCPAYHNYGGRGITVFPEWAASNVAFFTWAFANGYSERLELDRKNNDLGYGPDNCRWVTRERNCNNRRGNMIVTFEGEPMTVADLARKANLRYDILYQRIAKLGWSVEEAVYRPVRTVSQSSENISWGESVKRFEQRRTCRHIAPAE